MSIVKAEDKVVYSFSRLESFHTCQHGYYLTYVKGNREGDNIYSFLGSVMHDILENLQQEIYGKEKAIEIFEERFDDADMFGYEFMSENVKTKYRECLLHYLEHYEPIKAKDFKIEEYFEFEIEGIKMKGYIDFYYYDENGKIVVLDYKTSSKFSAKDLPKKARQLVLYGMALEDIHKEKNIEIDKVGFDMLKYVGKLWGKNKDKTTLKERVEVGDIEMATSDDYGKGYVFMDYNEDAKKDLAQYIKNTVNQIEELDSEDDRDWMPCIDFDKSFFCKTLCNHYKEGVCRYHNK